MKTFMLGIVSVGLVAVPGGWCVAAPAPGDLSEVAILKMRHPCRVIDLAFSPDGKTLFCADGGRVWLWDVASRKHVATFDHPNEGGGVGMGMAVSPDGSMIATYRGKTIMLWDVADRKEVATLEQDDEVRAIVFSPDGKTLSAMIDSRNLPRRNRKPVLNSLQIWDVEKQKRVRTCEVRPLLRPVSAYNGIKKPVLLEERTSVPIPGPGLPREPPKTIPFSLVDAFTGERVVTCELSKEETRFAPYLFCALNRAETMLATTGPMLSMQLWDRKSGKRIAAFKSPPVVSPQLAFSPEGRLLAACYPGGLLLFEVPGGKLLADRKQNGGFSRLAFSPDGRLLATGQGWDTIKLWSIPERWRKDK
jgi:WD40 repeat protein